MLPQPPAALWSDRPSAPAPAQLVLPMHSWHWHARHHGWQPYKAAVKSQLGLACAAAGTAGAGCRSCLFFVFIAFFGCECLG